MAYPNGTLFESAQTFPPYSEFGNGCVFPGGCVFENPCYFGKGCVFKSSVRLLRTDPRQPPHETQDGCIFHDGATIIYTIIGIANVISNPSSYEPVSEGEGTVVGTGNNRTYGDCSVDSTVSDKTGQVVSDCKVSTDWADASNPAGFDVGDHVTIIDKEWDINND